MSPSKHLEATPFSQTNKRHTTDLPSGQMPVLGR